MKHLLLSLLVAFTLASCGSDGNKVSTGTANYSNAIITDATGKAYATQLAERINASDSYFGYGIAGYSMYGTGITWKQAVETYYTAGKFHYTTSTAAAASANCELKWKIFYVCKQTTTTTSLTSSRVATVDNTDAGKSAKRTELMAILNNASYVTISGYSYLVQSQDGTLYEINTSLPLQANPVTKKLTTGSIEYLYKFSQY